MTFENRNYAFSRALVEELALAGLRHVCICPGSRSSPLAEAFADDGRVQKWFHLDERSAAFFALGIGRGTGMPAAVVSSSGTAAANFYPAVIEAAQSRTPLLIITADRPPELMGWGAPQTMDQTRLYGPYAKWSTTLPVPEPTAELARYVRLVGTRAVATAYESPAGPVHLDLAFREPLAPAVVEADQRAADGDASPEAWLGRADGRAYASVMGASRALDPGALEELGREMASAERGIIVCGWQRDPALPGAVTTLAEQLQWPVLADPLSQVRTHAGSSAAVMDAYDLFLREPALAADLRPDVVLRIGAPPTSKPLSLYLERHRDARHILLAPDGWEDPSHLSTDVVRGDPSAVCRALASHGAVADEAWLGRWRTANDAARQVVGEEMGAMEDIFEGRVFEELGHLLPPGAGLFAGNSMPVRDMETFLPASAGALWCDANRGVNGIDGVVSTALGFAAVRPQPTVLVLGDVSFYHDMNGLLAARRYGISLTIVVVNNNGGGIFHFLPIAAHETNFEDLYGTPHGMEFKSAAELYGLPYAKIDGWEGFATGVRSGLTSGATFIVEVPSDRRRNVALHARISDAVVAQMAGLTSPTP